jgi:hypothetical protein
LFPIVQLNQSSGNGSYQRRQWAKGSLVTSELLLS